MQQVSSREVFAWSWSNQMEMIPLGYPSMNSLIFNRWERKCLELQWSLLDKYSHKSFSVINEGAYCQIIGIGSIDKPFLAGLASGTWC